MKQRIEPFVMIDDIDDIYQFARENPSKKDFSVDTLCVGYPIVDPDKEDYHNFPMLAGPAIGTAHLLLEINSLISRECDKGHNYGPHDKHDYCIEVVQIEDNIAHVSIGS